MNAYPDPSSNSPIPREQRPHRAFKMLATILLTAVVALSPACTTSATQEKAANPKLVNLQQLIDRGDQVRITRKDGRTETEPWSNLPTDLSPETILQQALEITAGNCSKSCGKEEAKILPCACELKKSTPAWVPILRGPTSRGGSGRIALSKWSKN